MSYRFKTKDIPATVTKGVPDFCTVYVISKGKISSSRSASRPAPGISPLRNQLMYQSAASKHEPPPPLETQTPSPMPPTSNPKG